MTYRLITQDAPPVVEDARTQVRRRMQQRRCLVCGARQLHPHTYFCGAHFGHYGYCRVCEVVRPRAEHGKHLECRGCRSAERMRRHRDDPDAARYRLRLRQIAQRHYSIGEAVLATAARRIALADLVRRTPGMPWAERAALINWPYTWNALRVAYLRQCGGDVKDPDWCHKVDAAHTRKGRL